MGKIDGTIQVKRGNGPPPVLQPGEPAFDLTGHALYVGDGTTNTKIASTGGGTWGSITGTLANQTDLQTDLNAKVNTSTTVNGHALTGNVAVTIADLGLFSDNNIGIPTNASTITMAWGSGYNGTINVGAVTFAFSGSPVAGGPDIYACFIFQQPCTVTLPVNVYLSTDTSGVAISSRAYAAQMTSLRFSFIGSKIVLKDDNPDLAGLLLATNNLSDVSNPATALSNLILSGGSTTISTGVGSVKMSSANAATNVVWIPIPYAGTTYYVPGWTTNSP